MLINLLFTLLIALFSPSTEPVILKTIYKTYAHSFEKDEIQASNLMDEIVTLNSFEK